MHGRDGDKRDEDKDKREENKKKRLPRMEAFFL